MSVVAKRLESLDGIRCHFVWRLGLGPAHIVLDGDQSAPPNKGGRCPQFSARFYSGQTAGCIKMPLGMEVGLGPGHIVLDGGSTPPPTKKGAQPLFAAHVYCGQTAGWIKMPLVTEVGVT